MIKKILCLLFVFLLTATTSLVSQTVSILSVLATASTDENVLRDSAMEKYTSALNYKLPPVKKLEVRVGFNGNNTRDSLDGTMRNEDYYSVSLSSNNWREMKMQKQMKPAQTAIFTKEKEVFRMEAIKDRYTSVSNLYYSSALLKMKAELQELLMKKNELLKQLLRDGISINISDALETEKDLVTYTAAIQDEDTRIASEQIKLQQFLNSTSEVKINFVELIKAAKIVVVFNSLKTDSISINPLINYKEAQYRLARSNFNLEKSQNMNVFNSFQIGYNKAAYAPEILKKFNPDNTLTFRLGISVPFPGNFNYNRNKANIIQYDALLDWQNARIQQKKTITIQETVLESSIKQYRSLTEIYTNSVVGRILSDAKILAQSNAQEILDMKIARKKMEISILVSASNLMQSYIELLDSKGLLQIGYAQEYLLD